MNTFCPECGFGVSVDEDGLCLTCGATAVGSAVDQLLNDLADQLPHNNASQPNARLDAWKSGGFSGVMQRRKSA